MIVEIGNVNVMNVWSESFKGKDGEDVEFYRALLNVPGEPPMQLAVAKDDFTDLCVYIGHEGVALVEIDAKPGNRVRVFFRGLVEA